jgi:hypothetical protein
MAEPIAPGEQANYETFRECLSDPVLRSLAAPIEKPKKKKKSERKSLKNNTKADDAVQSESTHVVEEATNDAEELGEFIDVTTPFHYTKFRTAYD